MLKEQPINVNALRKQVSDPAFGAILVFEGVCRNTFDGREVLQLSYEAYEPMATAALRSICERTGEKFPGSRTVIEHRVGLVPLEEPTVVIATGAPHRDLCYQANRWALEQLKAEVPIWKKEIYAHGHAWKANSTKG